MARKQCAEEMGEDSREKTSNSLEDMNTRLRSIETTEKATTNTQTKMGWA